MSDNSNKYKVLCYLDNDTGRDVEIVMPVVFYAETYLNCDIEFAFVWDVHAIYRKKPDLVLLPNAIGSPLYYQISKYAFDNEIRVFALISEGNFRTNGTFDYWGYNKDKIIYQDYVCHWSERTLNFLSGELPQYNDKMVLTGATGFDRYKIYQFAQRQEFFRKKGLKDFKKVIGYAAWAFGKMYNELGRKEILYIHKDNPGRLKWMEDEMFMVESVLKQAVENNPDTLFLFKRHPNAQNPSIVKEGMNEIIRLKDYDNVLYLKEDENIHDLINISDLWTGFETTTAMESWVMHDNPTILINSDPEFKRDQLYKGSVIARSYEEFQKYLDEYFEHGTIQDFNTAEKVDRRARLIKDTIGFDDGMNHVRAGANLAKSLMHIKIGESKPKLSIRYLIMYVLLHIGKYFYIHSIFKMLPKFKKTIWLFENFRLKNLSSLKPQYFKYLSIFHKNNKKKIIEIVSSIDAQHNIK